MLGAEGAALLIGEGAAANVLGAGMTGGSLLTGGMGLYSSGSNAVDFIGGCVNIITE